MFVLVVIEDSITIEPRFFSNELEAIQREIKKKFVGRVLTNVGLITAFYDIVSIGTSTVYPGDGCARTFVTFRLISFRPFETEVIEGRIKASNEEGLQVTLGFFEDLFIPRNLLQHPSMELKFSFKDGVWYWEYENHLFQMELRMPVRVRVDAVVFNDPVSKRPPKNVESANDDDEPAPMVIIARMNESGLGNPSWWQEG
eukprot:TRINITY_DN9849_c0_g1_i2.p1 TRINITY_DN9849_c0_g1~~TRINITY_DN9849_c0_g1_i2.p1  ORF type:complete len:200 (-),score=19.53 TRINITY_DN9849_c0_g1_i2:136-735(-)